MGGLQDHYRRPYETLDYKKSMDMCQESIKMNQKKAKVA